MLGLKSKNELLEMQPSALSPDYQPDGRSSYEKSRQMMQKAFESGGKQPEWLHSRSNGEEFLSEITLTPIVLDGKKVLCVVWRDISDKKKAQDKLMEQTNILEYRTYHDLLTGLPNRNLFHEKLEQAIKKARTDSSSLALFFIDLDQFKQINDSLGHDVGDKVLKEVAGHLRVYPKNISKLYLIVYAEEGIAMKSIWKTIKVIDDSHYFKPWREHLLSDNAAGEWMLIFSEETCTESCRRLGEFYYEKGIPFVIVTEYIDEFFRHYAIEDHHRHHIKNGISESYLHQKLDEDERDLQQEIDKKLIGSLENKRYLVNAHLLWMSIFIKKVRGLEIDLELDPHCCTIGKWLRGASDFIDTDEYRYVYKTHDNLHALALSALRMYEKNEYAYFLLLYLDIIADSYKIRDKIIHIHFIKHLCSIYEDPLTGLYNYLQLFKNLDTAEGDKSLLLLNIREFSKINIIYGQERGNEIIKALADYLKNNEQIETAYRIYADEFAITIPTANRDRIIRNIKNDIEKQVFTFDDQEIMLRTYGSVGRKTRHILERCEFGLTASREHYGTVIDMDKMNEEVIQNYAERFNFSQRLRLAFVDKRILPYMQPIVDLRSGKIRKYEILMRIEDSDGRVMLPREFLPTLKKMYIFPEITKFIIKRSFEIFENEPYDFSINITYADIIDENIRAFIAAIIKENPQTAKRCTFELLENEAVQNLEEVNSFFGFLHRNGLKIALDDFGTGYANYETILQLDIDLIKIDGTLIKNIIRDHKSCIVVESIIAIARTTGAEVVAEWVCDREIFELVKELGVDYAQGYYIGKPSNSIIEYPTNYEGLNSE